MWSESETGGDYNYEGWCIVVVDNVKAWRDWWEPSAEENEEKVKYAYTSLIKGWQLGMDVFMPRLTEMEYLFYAIARPPPSTTRDGFPIIQ